MSHRNLSATIKIPKVLKDKLDNKRIISIYKNFEKSLNIKKNFVVAVSGGPDSLALAFLGKIYSLKNNLSSKFIIIDHRLRPESTKEAIIVKKVLKKMSIHLEILSWKGKKPLKNIQSLARKKRYELLFSKSDKLKMNNILIGHHQEDLYENFFIRILRGSGLKGLISLDKVVKIGKKNLLRPLIHLKKEDLIFISKYVFNFYITDPSNRDKKYQRIRVRQLINELQKDGLDKKKFNKTIENLKYSNKVIDYYVRENLEKNSYFSAKKNQLILNKDFFHNPQEVIFRSFSDVIQMVGKKYYPVRGKKIDKIINDLENGRILKVTIGGCIVEKVNETLIISKEH